MGAQEDVIAQNEGLSLPLGDLARLPACQSSGLYQSPSQLLTAFRSS